MSLVVAVLYERVPDRDDNAAGAQTERRGGAGPVRGLLGGKGPTGRFLHDQSSFRIVPTPGDRVMPPKMLGSPNRTR